MVLENKCLDAFKDPEKDQENADILDPGKLDGFPEARIIGDGKQVKEEMILRKFIIIIIISQIFMINTFYMHSGKKKLNNIFTLSDFFSFANMSCL